jgi:hypothetical protein
VHDARRESALCLAAELGLALETRQMPVELIGGAADEAVEQLYLRLRSGPRPFILLALAAAPRLARACRSLALLAGIPFLEIGETTFPLAIPSGAGEFAIYHSCFDLAGRLLAAAEAGSGLPFVLDATDTGWSRFWRLLEARLQAARSAEQVGAPTAPVTPAAAESTTAEVVAAAD